MSEEWRPVVNGRYAVSNLGRARREAPGKGTRAGWMLKAKPGKIGYPIIAISRGRLAYVHRLVAEAFLGPCPEGYEVNHKNGIKADNRLENLEYVTGSENMKHAFRLGLWKPTPRRGEQNRNAKLNDDAVRAIRRDRKAGVGRAELAARYGVSRSLITQVAAGIIWKHVA